MNNSHEKSNETTYMTQSVTSVPKNAWLFFRDICSFAKGNGLLALFLSIVLGLTEGVSILMLIPLMHYAGISDSGASGGGLPEYVVNVLNKSAIVSNLLSVLVFYIAVIALFAFIKNKQTLINAKIEQGFSRDLRKKLYSAVTYADWLFMTRTRDADLVHVLTSEINKIGSGTFFFLSLISTSVITCVHTSLAFLLSVPMTLFSIGFAGLLVFFMKSINRHALDRGKALYGAKQKMYNATMEHLAGIKLAKSFCAENMHLNYFLTLNDKITEENLRFKSLRARTVVFYDIGAVLAISILFYCAVTIFKLPVASLFLLVYLFARILPRVSTIHQNYQNIIHVLPAYTATVAMLKKCTEAAEPFGSDNLADVGLDNEIVFTDVGFQYNKKKYPPVLHNLTFVIPARCIIAIAGPSGAGKTTLADLIMGLLEPDKGGILIDGVQLSEENRLNWRRSVGYVPQDTFFFNDTIRSNLSWVRPDAGEDELWSVLEMAAAHSFVTALPMGLDTVIGDRGVQLSGGERQRLAIARALLKRPSILLLDEATSALDPENEKQIQTAFEKLSGRITLVVIAHRLSTIRRADRILLLDKGRIVESGTWKDLADMKDGQFRTMLRAMTVY